MSMIKEIALTVLAVSAVKGYDVGCKDSQALGAYGKCVDLGCCYFSNQDSSTELCTDGGTTETCCYYQYTCGRLGCLSVVGTWISNFKHHGSPDEVDLAFSTLKAKGVTRVYFNVWADGTIFARSDTATNYGALFGGDRLQWAIDAGKKYGVEVFAWFEYGSMVAFGDLNDFAINVASRGWLLCHDYWGSCTDYFLDDFAYMNLMEPDVVTFLAEMVADVVRNYPDLMGYQFDDHFSLPTKYEMVANVDYNTRITTTRNAIAKVRDYARGSRPDIHVSYSPSPIDWAIDHMSVDWRDFTNDGIVMEIVPQYYRWDFYGFQLVVDRDLPRVPRYENTLIAGIMLSEGELVPEGEVDKMVSYSYDKNLRGISFWLADNIINDSQYNPEPPNLC